VGAVPMTQQARRELEGLRHLLVVESVNGVPVRALEPAQLPLPVRVRHAALTSGRSENTFGLRDLDGERRQVSLPIGRPPLTGLPGLVFAGLGL
jgi:hypothetical protein